MVPTSRQPTAHTDVLEIRATESSDTLGSASEPSIDQPQLDGWADTPGASMDNASATTAPTTKNLRKPRPFEKCPNCIVASSGRQALAPSWRHSTPALRCRPHREE